MDIVVLEPKLILDLDVPPTSVPCTSCGELIPEWESPRLCVDCFTSAAVADLVRHL
jgi:hypothetical protein